ncbi:hypothetical protein [Mucilaginibacter antarcticus]|uniref:Lipocalin-like protein n=1 Tax=Mucilaginibacter antarcticus TaxID=1855725 RepID=A0ABW5XSQ7_9SPHI
MKYLATLLIVLSSFVVKAQLNSDKLIGTWELSEFSYNGNNVVPQIHGIKRYKLYTPTHFTVLEINLQTKVITTSFLGTYTLIDSNYAERIIYSSGPQVKAGGNYLAKVSFDNEDTMVMVAKLNGLPMDERWKKAKSDPFDTTSK